MSDKQQWAHPHKIEWTHPDAGVVTEFHHGMTMRQWYKGMALQGMLSDNANLRDLEGRPHTYEGLVGVAVALANAMLEEDAEHEGN